jgi:hypothetical protein
MGAGSPSWCVVFAGLDLEERVIALFRRHKNLPVTARWCLGNDGSWKFWEEGRKIADIPDLKVDWTLMPNTDTWLASEAYVDAAYRVDIF